MNLSIWTRLKLCWEIMTLRSGHKHPSQLKQLSTFQAGYKAGFIDASYEMKNHKSQDVPDFGDGRGK